VLCKSFNKNELFEGSRKVRILDLENLTGLEKREFQIILDFRYAFNATASNNNKEFYNLEDNKKIACLVYGNKDSEDIIVGGQVINPLMLLNNQYYSKASFGAIDGIVLKDYSDLIKEFNNCILSIRKALNYLNIKLSIETSVKSFIFHKVLEDSGYNHVKDLETLNLFSKLAGTTFTNPKYTKIRRGGDKKYLTYDKQVHPESEHSFVSKVVLYFDQGISLDKL